MNIPFAEQLADALLSGSGPLYLVLALVVLGALFIRRRTQNSALRRRALLVAGLVLIFALLQILLGRIPEQMARPDNLTYVVLTVTVLILGYLVALVIGTFVIVDFLLVRLLKFEIPNILRDAAVEAGKYNLELARKGITESDPSTLKEIEALGVTITRLSADEKKAFQAATRPVYDKWKTRVGAALMDSAEKAVAAR